MTKIDRIPWEQPDTSDVPVLSPESIVAYSLGDPWGHLVAIAHALGKQEEEAKPALSRYDRRVGQFVDGPLQGTTWHAFAKSADSAPLPLLVSAEAHRVVCDDPLALAEALAPELFAEDGRREALILADKLIDAVYKLGQLTDQAAYERAHAQLADTVEALNADLEHRRFLGAHRPGVADVVLFTFSVRLDPVFYELHKATIGRLADFKALQGHARDLYERPAFYETTDFDAIKEHHYLVEPVLNPKKLVPAGGLPDLDAPHFRAESFGARNGNDAVEEDQHRQRTGGEWVRPPSEQRDWIRAPNDDEGKANGEDKAAGEGKYVAQPGRYHLYAPFNCPWSHRALLGRAVLGLEQAVGASIVYFRRDPDRGWQFNPDIPGCTADLANGTHFVEELYESVGSKERSVPILWDTETNTIASNESADILRMFATEFGQFAERTIELYPPQHRAEIDQINAAVYQRINNGAYKAGFANSQLAYERAFARYFRALDWLETLLGERRWLASSEHPTEADLRLFPTVFRHDAVYYARFKLNLRRISDYPRLSDWLDRMMQLPGVREGSNLDHARNGYFGRTGNEIVPAGPIPLELSPKDFSRAVWLNEDRT